MNLLRNLPLLDQILLQEDALAWDLQRQSKKKLG
jgi:hypothetical protein